VSRYTRTQTDVVDAIQVEFNTPREELRAFDKHVMVSPDWNGFDQWIMLPSGEREFCFGDWIVRNEAGRLFFCDAETFAADYSEEIVAADLTPYQEVIDAWVKVFAAASVTPFDFRKDIYLGGGADFRDTDFRDFGYMDEEGVA